MRTIAAVLGLLIGVAPGLAQVDPELGFWMAEARRAVAENDRERAKEAVARALAIDPGNPEARDMEARVSPDAAGYVPGFEAPPAMGFEAAPIQVPPEQALALLREDPFRTDAAELKRGLGEHYFKQAQMHEAAGKRGAAMVAFRRALFFHPGEALLRYEFFQALTRRGRLKESLEQAEAFLELQTQGALADEMRRQLIDVHTRLGTKKMKANRWGLAIRHFRKVLGNKAGQKEFGEVEEKLAVCYYTLGVREAANGRRLPACEAFSALLELRPGEGIAQETFDRQYFDKLRKSALSPLWNQGKKSKEEGRLIEAYRFFGHVITLGNQGWMLKLAKQYRAEIQELAGDSIAAEEDRLRRGLPWGTTPTPTLTPPLEWVPGAAATVEDGMRPVGSTAVPSEVPSPKLALPGRLQSPLAVPGAPVGQVAPAAPSAWPAAPEAGELPANVEQTGRMPMRAPGAIPAPPASRRSPPRWAPDDLAAPPIGVPVPTTSEAIPRRALTPEQLDARLYGGGP